MRNRDVIQYLARRYLRKIRDMANIAGLNEEVDKLITENEKGDCRASKEQVELMCKAFDESNIKLHDIPKELGKSYRYMDEHNLVKNIHKYENKGLYSLLDVLILKEKLKGGES